MSKFLDLNGLETLWGHIVSKLNQKVNIEEGKGLSTNDYTTEEKNKLSNIEAEANKTIVDEELNESSNNPVQNKVIHSVIASLNERVGETSVAEQIEEALSDVTASGGIYVGPEAPIEDSYNAWIDSDSDEGYDVPEVKDDEISAVDTWSSNRIKIATDGARAYNLLVNSNFADPINTRGKSSYTGFGGKMYTIDKWYTWSPTMRVILQDGYISISHSDDNEYQQLTQDITSRNMIGKVITLAVWDANDGVYCASGTLAQGAVIANTDSSDFWMATQLDSAGTHIVSIYPRVGKTVSIKHVALYLGSYTVNTLPPYVAPDKRLEVIRCLDTMPENLLDNSNFLDPVNSLRLTTLSEKGELINRWENDSAAVTSSISGSGLLASGDNGIRQKLKHQYIGKTLTLAFKNANEAITCFSVTVTSPDTIKWLSVNYDNNMFGGVMQRENGDLFVYLHSTTIPIIWAALYEGVYTAETLPLYIPKSKKTEMINCGVPLQPVNLLDNSDFLNPINQRGLTTYTGQGTYTIDRWKQAYNGSKVAIADNGLTITPGTSVQGWLRQYFEKPFPVGTQVSLYVELADGTIEVFPVSLPEAATYRQGKGYITGFNTIGIDLVVNVGDPAVTFQRVALYKGNYNTNTVPQYQSKESVVELIQARTQLQPLMRGQKDEEFIATYIPGASYLKVQIPLNPPMRVAPSVYNAGSAMPRAILYDSAGNVSVYPVTEIGLAASTTTSITLKFTIGSTLPTDYRMATVDNMSNSSDIFASAEM